MVRASFPEIRVTVMLSERARCSCNAPLQQFKRAYLKDIDLRGGASVAMCGTCFDTEMKRRETVRRDESLAAAAT